MSKSLTKLDYLIITNLFLSACSVKQMDPWTRPRMAATLWPKWNWMMEKENLPHPHPTPPLPCEPPRTKEHFCGSQTTYTDTLGPKTHSLTTTTPFFILTDMIRGHRLFGLMLWPFESISSTVTDNTFSGSVRRNTRAFITPIFHCSV